MKNLLRSLFTGVLFVSSLCMLPAQQRNIIVILADDLGYHSLGCNGSTAYSTPVLDALASQGVRYTQCRSAPNCSPSRFMLLTGKYNFRNYNDWSDIQPTERSIASMLKDAGYETAIYGKWQLNGGDFSIRSLGFNQYCVHDPFKPNDENEEVSDQSRYKNPVLYSNGKYINHALTQGKYGEDIFTDSLKRYITKNKNKPFFALYTMVSPHIPFTPTPDDAAFASWDPNAPARSGDTIYYPSMVKYMDKKIGEIVAHLKSLDLDKNTTLLFTADNGSTQRIHEYYNGQIVQGGKNETTEAGTRVPLIVWSPGYVSSGMVSNQLIDFTDFLPTLAHLANFTPLQSYEPLDGNNFLQVFSKPLVFSKPYVYMFNDRRLKDENDTLVVWAQTNEYKLYDTVAAGSAFKFYNIVQDPFENNPLHITQLSTREILIQDSLRTRLAFYRQQWQPIFATPIFDSLNSSYVRVRSTVFTDGGTIISERGLVWDTIPNPTLEFSNVEIDNRTTQSFYNNFSGAFTSKYYFFRTYTRSNNGIAYSPILVKPPVELLPPTNIKTSDIRQRRVTISWSPQTYADGYQIDVSRRSNFLSPTKQDSVIEAFNRGNTLPPGWTFGSGISKSNLNYGDATPGMMFSDSASTILTNNFGNPTVSLSFWIDAKRDATGKLLLEGLDGNNWNVIDEFEQNSTAAVRTYTTGSPGWKNNFVQFRFTSKTNGATLYLDDVKIITRASEFIGIYDSLFVTDTSVMVTNLSPNTVYFYRLRTVIDDSLSSSSNRKAVRTQPLMAFERTDKLQIIATPNPVQNQTTLFITNASAGVTLFLYDMQGNLLWRSPVSFSENRYVIGMENVKPGRYQLFATDSKHTTSIQILKQ